MPIFKVCTRLFYRFTYYIFYLALGKTQILPQLHNLNSLNLDLSTKQFSLLLDLRFEFPQLLGQNFSPFLTTSLNVDIFSPESGQKYILFWPPTHLMLSTYLLNVPLTWRFFDSHTLLYHVKWKFLTFCCLSGTTTNQKLLQGTVDPLDPRSPQLGGTPHF